MTEYEQGFADGERTAFKDRQSHIRRSLPTGQTQYANGWRDGYTPRSMAWAVRGTQAAPAWWQERESEAA